MMATSHIIKLLLLMISLQLSRSTSLRRLHPSFIVMSQNKRKALSSTTDSSDGQPPPVYRAEGLMAVHKPLTWTSQDVVSYIRGIITRDAQDRNALGQYDGGGNNRGKRKKQMLKVGHGGTLDPLASGVLVIGIGKGTTKLQGYLEGDKRYVAVAELGYETTTLDAEGDIVKEVGYDYVKSITNIEEVLPKFRGEISQVPPLYSAIQIDGKRLYEIARKGEGDDVEIPTRQVMIHDLQAGSSLDDDVIKSGVVFAQKYREAAEEKKKDLKAAADAKAEADDAEQEEKNGNGKKRGKHGKKRDKKPNLFTDATVPMITSEENKFDIPQFTLSISCGGGTYIRSLVRDIGYECGSVATMTGLVRTKQGPFVLGDALRREEWTADKIYEAIVKSNKVLEEMDGKS
ncbi:hypothetical protein ACHAWO_003040 [Cyclotella atomus]|uniref:tRNA pseudouridine(55) synthase n=1 Tax=Cyclotella atomus TaxID=382360 RepID=A0ABD3NJE4_9STRA